MRLSRLSLVAAGLLLASATFSHADTILSNINSPGSVIGGLAARGNPYLALGIEFTPSSDVTLTETQVIMFSNSGSNAHFNELLFSDNGGVPGTLIATLATGLTSPRNPGLVDATGLSAALTAGENYWFVLTPQDGGSFAAWGLNAPSSLPLAFNTSGSPTGGWTPEGGANLQVALFGTSTVATPEPSAFVLLGTGILGLAGATRRKLFA